MNCDSADNCPWLQRFGVKVCHRFFRLGRCKPIDEGSDDNEETPVERGKETAETVQALQGVDGRCGHRMPLV